MQITEATTAWRIDTYGLFVIFFRKLPDRLKDIPINLYLARFSGRSSRMQSTIVVLGAGSWGGRSGYFGSVAQGVMAMSRGSVASSSA